MFNSILLSFLIMTKVAQLMLRHLAICVQQYRSRRERI